MMGFPYTPGRVAGWCELAGELSYSEESRTGLSRATLLRNASEPWVASRRVVRDPNPLLPMFAKNRDLRFRSERASKAKTNQRVPDGSSTGLFRTYELPLQYPASCGRLVALRCDNARRVQAR